MPDKDVLTGEVLDAIDALGLELVEKKVVRDPLADGVWVLFTDSGIPAWFGFPGIEGAEWVEGKSRDELVAQMRLPDGTWTDRPPPPPPTAEDLALRQAELDRQQANIDAAEARWREDEITRRAAPDQLLRSMGKITIAELTARVAAIRAEVEAGR